MNHSLKRVLIVGDSISLGVTDIIGNEIRQKAAHSYVEQLSERFPNWQFEVDAMVRRTTSHALQVVGPLLAQYHPHIVIFLLGGGDVDLNWKQFIVSGGERIRHTTPAALFESNLRQLAAETLQAGACPVFSALPDQNLAERGRQFSAQLGCDVTKMIEVGGGQAESERRRGVYINVIEKVALDTGALLARWPERVRALPLADRFGPDALHPSDSAHILIAQVIGDLLEQQSSCESPKVLAAAKS